MHRHSSLVEEKATLAWSCMTTGVRVNGHRIRGVEGEVGVGVEVERALRAQRGIQLMDWDISLLSLLVLVAVLLILLTAPTRGMKMTL